MGKIIPRKFTPSDVAASTSAIVTNEVNRGFQGNMDNLDTLGEFAYPKSSVNLRAPPSHIL